MSARAFVLWVLAAYLFAVLGCFWLSRLVPAPPMPHIGWSD